MANDFDDIDYPNIPIFPMFPNWAVVPSSDIVLARTILEYRGSAQRLIPFTGDVPISYNAKYTAYNKEEEYGAIDFWNERKGKKERFWTYHPRLAFEIKYDIGAGATSLACYHNYAESQYQGYERIYILMNNGDILTKHVTNVTYDELQDELVVELATQLDRDVTLTNHYRIGRFLLSRFDEDEMTLTHLTDGATEFNARFYELVKEYDEI